MTNKTMIVGLVIGMSLGVALVRADDPFLNYLEQQQRQQIADSRREMVASAIQNTHDYVAYKQEFNAKIAKARRNVWAAYPDKADFAEARKALADLLYEKDLSFMMRQVMLGPNGDMITVVDSSSGGPLDGGITPASRRAFTQWCDTVQDQMRTAARKDSEGLDRLLKTGTYLNTALATPEAQQAYAKYALLRDWAEFDAVHKVMPELASPENYVAALILRDKDQATIETARADAHTARTLIGDKLFDECATTISNAEKTADGNVKDLKALGLTATADHYPQPNTPMPSGTVLTHIDPLSCLYTLLGTKDNRTWLLVKIANAPYAGWKGAQERYDYYVKEYGEQSVMSAVDVIKGVVYRSDGVIYEPLKLGSDNRDPLPCFEFAVATAAGKPLQQNADPTPPRKRTK